MREETRWYHYPGRALSFKGARLRPYYRAGKPHLLRADGSPFTLDFLEQLFRLRPHPRPIIGDP